MLKNLRERIGVERDNLVFRRESTGSISGTERMMALGGGIRARVAKTKEGLTVVNEFLFDRNRFDETAVESWLEKNEETITKSVAKVQENAPRGSFSDITMRLCKALNDAEVFPANEYGCCMAYIAWVFSDYIVVDYQNQYYRVDYSEDEKGGFTFQEPAAVDMEFVARESSALKEKLDRRSKPNCSVTGDIKFRIRENSMDKAKREIVAVLIEAGTNYDKRRHYPKKTIQESAHLYAGLKMYLDHPTAQEEEAKPERSIRDWLSTIVESWYEEGAALGRIKVHSDWFWNLLESDPVFREQIGISINASGRRGNGQINGQQMEIIEEIVAPKSVDWVTEPGARGRVLELLESNRIEQEKKTMWKTLKEIKENAPSILKEHEMEIREAVKAEHEADKAKAVREAVAPVQAELDTLKGKDLKEKKTAKIKELVEASSLPAKAKTKVIAALESKEFKTVEEIDAVAKAAIQSELEYLSEVGGVKIGAGKGKETLTENAAEALEERLGLTEKKEEKK